MVNFFTVISAVDGEDRIVIRVKDVGLWPSERLGGMVGPAIIANATIPVGQDFDGYLELEPNKGIPNNGNPVCQVVARFSQVGAAGNLPVPGIVAAVVDTLGASPASSGVPGGDQASAPTLQAMQATRVMEEPRVTEVTEEPEAESSHSHLEEPVAQPKLGETRATSSGAAGATSSGATSSGAAGATSSGATSSGVPEPKAPSSGVPEQTSSGVPEPSPSPSPQASSGVPEPSPGAALVSTTAFFIDLPTFTFNCPIGTFEYRLLQKQEDGSLGPYPADPLRNYNVLAAGFDMATWKHERLWPGAEPEMFPPDKVVDPVHKQVKKLLDERPTEFWSLGVPVLCSFLASIKANS